MSSAYSHLPNSDFDLESDDLSMNLVGPSRDAPTLQSSHTPLLSVIAPATLPEGYEFETIVGNARYMVTVPPGGVEIGQKFEVPLPSRMVASAATIAIPVGHWRDSLFGCFSHGPCHPHLWTGLCCGLLAAGQVIRRLKLTAWGKPGSVGQTEIAFKVIFMALVVYLTIYIGLYLVLLALAPNAQVPTNAYMAIFYIRSIWHYLYMIALTIVLFNLRGYVRRKYAIPGSETEDCCCSCWCPCLVATQLMRHTTDYDTYPSLCCSETGLPKHAPEIV
ncbi:hypothetical protein MPSEU_000525500 [Mayamaea pseudoterrestris]|nr:hypothetical protein MPSEU_000525500 [Mayamaea pseudoterrestris]